jgi:hypothetical protein
MLKQLSLLLVLSGCIFISANAQLSLVYSSCVYLNDVYSLNADTVFACGNKGRIVSTTHGGDTWLSDSLPTLYDLKSIVMLKTGIGYIAGNSGTIFRSVDYGKNWEKMPVISNDYDLTDLQLVNDSVAFVKITGKGIWSTTDTGKTWKPVLMRPKLNNHLYIGNTGYVAGDEKLFWTLNLGQTWDSASFKNDVNVWHATAKEILISSYFTLYLTADTCKTFQLIYPGFMYTSIFYGNSQFIGDYGIVAEWYVCTCLDPVPPTLYISKTYDNGRTWSSEYEPVSFYGTKFSFATRDLGYIIAYYSIYKTTTGILGVYVGNNVLNEKQTDKVFPNPVTDISTITLPEGEGYLKFQLYNSLGQMVETRTISSENNTITRGNKPAGVYEYRIYNNNRLISSGKLIFQ